MIRILSIFLLMIYTLTSTGATVYYHTCGQNARVSLSENETSHRSCAFCAKEERHHQHSKDCSSNQESCDHKSNCCTDVQVQLKNSDEQVVSGFLKAFHVLSPAEIVIPWIILFHQNWIEEPKKSFSTILDIGSLSTYPDPYLLHCNFRI